MSPSTIEGWPSRDLDELVAYFEIEPMPDPTRDAASICAVIANCHRKEGARPFRAEDFTPRPAGSGREQSAEEMMAALDAAGR